MASPDQTDLTLIDEAGLWFDASNPRLRGIDENPSQAALLETLWKDFAVDEVALSIAANGFFRYEPLFAAEENGHLVVIEGNRRLAAVRLLRHTELRNAVGATDLPRLDAARRQELEQIPVVIGTRAGIWQYVGFKHVNGPQAWRSHSKAQYIAWVHNELGVDLDQIAEHIGDRHYTVRRLYRALMVLDQAETSGVWSLDDRYKPHFSFSHLYTGLDYQGIQAHVALDPDKSFRPNPIRRTKLEALGELCVWLFGSKSRGIEPLVRSQNPDLRTLDDVLQSRDGVAALRSHLPLSVSRDIAMGDDRLFREALVTAKNKLQDARGRLIQGYAGEADLLRIAEDIADLAEVMLDDMRRQRSSRRGRTAGRPS